MQNPYQKIIDFLKQQNVKYQELTHEPVYTSEQAAAVRGLNMHQGAKSLLLKTDKEFILAVLPGDVRLDTKKLKQVLNSKNLRFANPTEVEEIMNCQVGSCYPLGNIFNIKTLVDKTLVDNEVISFNPGVHNKSIKLRFEDYLRLVKPKVVEIS